MVLLTLIFVTYDFVRDCVVLSLINSAGAQASTMGISHCWCILIYKMLTVFNRPRLCGRLLLHRAGGSGSGAHGGHPLLRRSSSQGQERPEGNAAEASVLWYGLVGSWEQKKYHDKLITASNARLKTLGSGSYDSIKEEWDQYRVEVTKEDFRRKKVAILVHLEYFWKNHHSPSRSQCSRSSRPRRRISVSSSWAC